MRWLEDVVSGAWSAPQVVVIGLLGISVVSLVFALYARRRMLDQVEESDNLRNLIDNLSEGVYRSTLDGKQISANRALVQLNGFATEDELIQSVGDIAQEWYVDPNRRSEFAAILHRDGVVKDFISEIYRHKTRERIWINEGARLVYSRKTGLPAYYEGSVREITETVKRLQLEEQFRKLTDQVPGGLFQLVRHADGRFTTPYLSRGFRTLTGIRDNVTDIDPAAFASSIFRDDIADYVLSLKASGQGLQPWNHEFRMVMPDGKLKWISVSAMPEKNADRSITWHGYVMDVSLRKQNEGEIEKLAYFDMLTQLPNRRQFLDRMAQTLASCARTGQFGALLFVDLDNFKLLNDTCGHDIGDRFLIQVAARLCRCIRPDDIVARIGGDEFVVILEPSGRDLDNIQHRANKVAGRILDAFREGFDIANIHHVATVSIGLSIFDGAAGSVDDILKRADIAMYQAKALGKNTLAMFDPVVMDGESERFKLLTELREAFRQGELVLHYQPQVDSCGQVRGAEGLIRWNHPARGLVMPGAFVELAEQSGLNAELCNRTLSLGLGALARWKGDPVMGGMRLALNIGVPSFSAADFVPMIKDMLGRHDFETGLLTFELTEHVMATEQERMSSQMQALKDLGIRLSLDDFGTGYSSLAYLKQMPFDEVKIDGSFVHDIETHESDRALVKTILAMARLLGLEVVAEQVENLRQEAFLKAFSCDYMQGFLYSPALTEAEFVAFCRDRASPVGG